MKIVLDTNVLVSALLNPSGPPASVVSLALSRSVILLLDNRVLFEYEDVLRRDRFGFPTYAVDALLDFFKTSALFINPAPTSLKFTDDGDKPFYEVAVSGEAEFLVTGNKRHSQKKPMVVAPRQFLDFYARDK